MSLVKPTISKLHANSKEIVDDVTRLLIKIADNILKDPTNLKVRTLQKSNPTVSKKILSANGGLECLKMMGFEENDTHLILPPSACLRTLQAVRDEISNHHNESIMESAEPNVFLGLIENNSLENHDTNAIDSSSDVSSGSSSCESENENENETKSSSASQGAIPKVSNQPGEASNEEESLNPTALTMIPQRTQPDYMFSNLFLRRIELAFHMALRYGDKGLREYAKKLIPLERLEVAAQKRLRSLQEQVKKGETDDVDISIQDMLILELLSWFKNEFFTWVDSPLCKFCGRKTRFSHMSRDRALLIYTNRVEMHECVCCEKFTAFPRYQDPSLLLLTKKGRCGEWANVFTLLCCALDWDARYVVDEGDHVWTEVYSFAQKRWLHCDPCENVCDTPLMYENGWGKKNKLCYRLFTRRGSRCDVAVFK